MIGAFLAGRPLEVTRSRASPSGSGAPNADTSHRWEVRQPPHPLLRAGPFTPAGGQNKRSFPRRGGTPAVCRWSSCRLPSAVSPSAVCRLPSAVCRLPSSVFSLLSTQWLLPSRGSCPLRSLRWSKGGDPISSPGHRAAGGAAERARHPSRRSGRQGTGRGLGCRPHRARCRGTGRGPRALYRAGGAPPAWETLPFEHVSPNVGTMARRAPWPGTSCAGPSQERWWWRRLARCHSG